MNKTISILACVLFLVMLLSAGCTDNNEVVNARKASNDMHNDNVNKDINTVQESKTSSVNKVKKEVQKEVRNGISTVHIMHPTALDKDLESDIKQLQEILMTHPKINKVEVVDGEKVSCTDTHTFRSSIIILLGTKETNPSLHCYPSFYQQDSMNKDRNAWASEGHAIILYSDKEDILKMYGNSIVMEIGKSLAQEG
jgi:hypothetical protein